MKKSEKKEYLVTEKLYFFIEDFMGILEELSGTVKFSKRFLNSFQNEINFKKYRFAGKRWLTFDQ